MQVVNSLSNRPCSKDKAVAYHVAHWMGDPRLELTEAEKLGGRMRIHAGKYDKAVAVLDQREKVDLRKAKCSLANFEGDADDDDTLELQHYWVTIQQEHDETRGVLLKQVSHVHVS